MPKRRAVVIVFVRRARRHVFIQAPRLVTSTLMNVDLGHFGLLINWIRLLQCDSTRTK